MDAAALTTQVKERRERLLGLEQSEQSIQEEKEALQQENRLLPQKWVEPFESGSLFHGLCLWFAFPAGFEIPHLGTAQRPDRLPLSL
jgi:hypothetical protein